MSLVSASECTEWIQGTTTTHFRLSLLLMVLPRVPPPRPQKGNTADVGRHFLLTHLVFIFNESMTTSAGGKELARLFRHVPGATRMAGAAVRWKPGGLRHNVLLNEDKDSPLKCVEACRDGSIRFTFERPDERTKAILARLLEIEGEARRLPTLVALPGSC